MLIKLLLHLLVHAASCVCAYLVINSAPLHATQ